MIAGAEALLDGLLARAARFGVSAFAITVAIAGFELENLAAEIGANAAGLPGAGAGTFLGGTTLLALGVAGLAALIAPIDARHRPAAAPERRWRRRPAGLTPRARAGVVEPASRSVLA